MSGKRILREIAILSKLKHEYIVRLYDIVLDPDSLTVRWSGIRHFTRSLCGLCVTVLHVLFTSQVLNAQAKLAYSVCW